MATASREEVPAPQPIQQAEDAPRPLLQQGFIQNHEGYLRRKSTILKRWKKEWLKIQPGEHFDTISLPYEFIVPQ